MNFHVHVAAGLAVGSIFATLYPNIGIDQNVILGSSVILSVVPDVNLLWKDTKNHHKDFTHYPFFWFATLVFVTCIEFFLYSSLFWSSLIGLNILIHLILDTFGWTIGVHWLWPFLNKEYSFTELKKDKIDIPPRERILKIFTHKLTIAETLVSILSLSLSYFLLN